MSKQKSKRGKWKSPHPKEEELHPNEIGHLTIGSQVYHSSPRAKKYMFFACVKHLFNFSSDDLALIAENTEEISPMFAEMFDEMSDRRLNIEKKQKNHVKYTEVIHEV